MLVVRRAAADSYWNGGTGDFSVSTSWNPAGVPNGVNAINDSGSNNVVLLKPGDPVWTPQDVRAGDGGGASGAYVQTGSTNKVSGWFRLGDNAGAFGSYTLSNGTVNAALQAHVGEAGAGVLTVLGGKFSVGQTPFCLGDGDFGPGGSGTLDVEGGSVSTPLGVDLWLGEGYNGGSGGNGTMIVKGGSVSIGGWFAIGRFGGNGDLELYGGNITLHPDDAGNLTVATTPSVGIVNQTGGALTNSIAQTWVAESGQGIWNLNSGVDFLGTVLVTRLSGATGIFNLNGGDLYAVQILDSGNNGTFNFNGGTLHARVSSGNFLQAYHGINVRPGGAIIDTGNNSVTINQPFTDAGGGLTKLGSGSLTLSADMLYSGPTIVSNGTLTIAAPNGFMTSSCAVSSGAAFGVTLTEADAALYVPNLDLGSASALTFDFAGVGGQPMAPLQAGNVALQGTTTLNIAGFDFSTGQFPLLQYDSISGAGGFSLGSLPAGMAGQIVTNAADRTIDLIVTAPSTSLPWQPKTAALMTDWAQQVDPTNVLPEYPRPQMVRSNWLNLNGIWQFQIGAPNDAAPAGENLAGVILVPFPMESALSGVMQYHPYSWYRRQFTVPTAWAGQKIILHFDAVNWRSEVYVNGHSMGIHNGGYDPFSYDITPYLAGAGPQEVIVRVYSPEDAGGEPRGKQTLYPAGIMFTSASGIWQSVWLEPAPSTSINGLHLVPDIDARRLQVAAAVDGPTSGVTVTATAFDGTNQVSSAIGPPGGNFYLNVPTPKLWSPTNPFLYGLRISLSTNGTVFDSVASYFGMRKISLGTNNGFVRLFLNNQFVFQFGPLDQGFWPDGVYTAPTDLALKSDLEMEKALGFNMVRKHIKVEPQRWYYWADTLGLLVWQDMPSCNSYTTNPSPPPVDPLDFIAELTAMVTNHWNSPAIIMWDIFNEGQGEAGSGNGVNQTNTPYLVGLVKSLDPSRLVNQASGWTYYGAGDILDQHNYPDPMCPISGNLAVACGEFGGVWLGVSGHTWSPGPGEVSPAQAATSVASQFESLANELPDLIQGRGMSAAVYTEISDVEIELAGLRTFDRKILKPDLRRMQTAITAPMTQYNYSTLIPASQVTGQNWKYTFTQPATNWAAAAFDDSQWTNGIGGFGAGGSAGITVRTTWNTADIWLRRIFNPGALTTQQISNLVFNVYHDDDCEIYINGILAASVPGYGIAYGHVMINAAGLSALAANANNLLAVHCHQSGGPQGIDVGIDTKSISAPPPPIFVPNWTENGTGLAAEYVAGTNAAITPAFTRTDPNIDFNWSNGSPGGGITNGPFSALWMGKIQPRYSEGYTFHLTLTGSGRLWVDGQLVIDKSTGATNGEVTGSISLTGGRQYDLRVEYDAPAGPAGAILEWSSASQAREIIPEGVLFPGNLPPILAAIPDFTLTAGQMLRVTNSATDADVPPQTLSWALATAPPGSEIDSTSGLISWRPTISQSPSTNLFSVVVSDNGSPSMSATQSFAVDVRRPISPSFMSPTVAGGGFQSEISGDVGPDYSVFTSTNLAGGWQLLLVTNPLSMPFSFVDPLPANFQKRFYRVQLGP